jgi:hypothetical protein
MNYIWTAAVDEILHQGYWLGNVGVQNWALNRNAALDAFSQLERTGVAVLGGDVYVKKGGEIQPNYDNWYCERGPGETALAFTSRSIQVAREYITTYSTNRNDVLFALVPQVSQL